MIVEDEILLAMELAEELEAAGHEIYGQAMSSSEALKLVDKDAPDLAFIDMHLADGPTGVDIGYHLADRDIPFIFVTGNIKRIPADFAGAIGAIEKPYTVNGLRNALAFIEQFITGHVDGHSAPPSLYMSAAQTRLARRAAG